MFILISKYKVPLEQVEQITPAHRAYLQLAYQAGKLLVSGPQVPRTGGLIVALVKTREEADALIREDPYCQQKIADYEVIEFEARSFHPSIADLV